MHGLFTKSISKSLEGSLGLGQGTRGGVGQGFTTTTPRWRTGDGCRLLALLVKRLQSKMKNVLLAKISSVPWYEQTVR